MVRVDNTSDVRRLHTGVRLRTDHLIPLDSTSARHFIGAVKDEFGVWSEWSEAVAATTSNFVDGYDQCSIGSAKNKDVDIQEPQVILLRAQIGSSQTKKFKTDTFGAWPSEVRGTLRNSYQRAYTIVWQDLKSVEMRLISRWLEAMTGALKFFWTEWFDPYERRRERMVSRLDGQGMSDALFSFDHSEASIDVIEQIEAARGGEK